MKTIIRHVGMTAALLTGALVLAIPASAQTGNQSSFSNFGKTGSSASLSAQNNSKIAPDTMDSDKPQAEMEATVAPPQNSSPSGSADISAQSSFSHFGKVGSVPDVPVQ